MNEEKLVLDNIGLIYLMIEKLHCYWRTDDDFQDLYDAGLEGLIRGAKTYKGESKPSTYLCVCIKHSIVRHIQLSEHKCRVLNKKAKISLDKPIDEKGNTLLDFIEDNSVDIEKEIENKIMVEDIIKIIDTLKDKQDREIIKMYFGIDGYRKYNAKELGDMLGINRTTMQMRITRLIKKLRRKVKGVKIKWT